VGYEAGKPRRPATPESCSKTPRRHRREGNARHPLHSNPSTPNESRRRPPIAIASECLDACAATNPERNLRRRDRCHVGTDIVDETGQNHVQTALSDLLAKSGGGSRPMITRGCVGGRRRGSAKPRRAKKIDAVPLAAHSWWRRKPGCAVRTRINGASGEAAAKNSRSTPYRFLHPDPDIAVRQRTGRRALKPRSRR